MPGIFILRRMVISERARGWLSVAALFGTGRAALFEFLAPSGGEWTGLLGDATPQVAFAALAAAAVAVLAARVATDTRLRRTVAGVAAALAVPTLAQAVLALPNPYIVAGFVVATVGLVGLAITLWQPPRDVSPWPRTEPSEAATSYGPIASVPLFFMIVVVASRDATPGSTVPRGVWVTLAVVAFLFAVTVSVLAGFGAARPALRERLAGPAVVGGLLLGLAALASLGEPDPSLRLVGLMLCAGAVGLAGLGISLRRYRDEPASV